MGTTPNAISGADSSAGSIGSDIDLGVVDTPAIDPQEQVTDTTAEGTVEGQQPVEQTPETEQAKEDGRRIPASIRSIKDSNPEAYAAAKAALFESLAWKQVFPSIQEARKVNDLVKSVGGAEGLTTLRTDATFFKEASTQFAKGDPAFIKDLWDEDPIAAALHVTPMLDHYRQSDPEGFNSTITRLWDKEFEAVGLGNGLSNLQEAIKTGNKEAALSILKSIGDWKDSISGIARRAEDPRVKSLLAERAKQHDTKQQTEHQEFLKSYRTETINDVSTDAFKIFDSFFKGQKIDPEDRKDLVTEAARIANAKVEADKDFVTQRDDHLKAGDAHSARQLTKARFAREFPDAIKRIARRYKMVGAPAIPGQQTRTEQQPGQQNRTPGWTVVSSRPEPEEIDRSRTSNDMIISGKAILRNGRKVDWSKLKQR